MSSIQITKWTTATFANVGRVCPAVSYTNLTLTCPPGPKASIVHDPHSRESQRFGFVTIEMTEEAEAAIDGSYMVDIVGL